MWASAGLLQPFAPAVDALRTDAQSLDTASVRDRRDLGGHGVKDIDWDALTFSLTPTDWMYVAEVNAGEPWMPGARRSPSFHSPAAGVLNLDKGCLRA